MIDVYLMLARQARSCALLDEGQLTDTHWCGVLSVDMITDALKSASSQVNITSLAKTMYYTLRVIFSFCFPLVAFMPPCLPPSLPLSPSLSHCVYPCLPTSLHPCHSLCLSPSLSASPFACLLALSLPLYWPLSLPIVLPLSLSLHFFLYICLSAYLSEIGRAHV